MIGDSFISQEELCDGAKLLGIELSKLQISQFLRYAELLEEWNAKINLTRVPAEEWVSRHFLDSIASSKACDFSKGGRLVDVGSGAGLPGIPLKIVFPSLKVTLLDSTKKRLDFIDVVISDLKLSQTETLHARAEEAGRNPKHREKYDFAIARAVARINILSEWMLPLVKTGGHVLMLKSEEIWDELDEGEKACKTLGGDDIEVIEVQIPESEVLRKIVSIKKKSKTPPAYPRAGGVINKKPL